MSERDFGRYALIKKLATGGMAEVYLARQKGLEGFEKLLVIKRILPHLADDQEFVDMFLNEARIAARFSHPNIVQIYDLGREDDSFYIAMEYIHGEDLGRVMRQAATLGKAVPPHIALRLIASACEGLHYAHTKTDDHGRPLQVVHRDISPQNIIVSFEGSTKLVDFGIARAADQASNTATGALKGKFAYMAPEQAAGRVVDHRTDLFALGLVLYELLSNVRPLRRDTDIATLTAVLQCQIPPPSEVAHLPAVLDELVMKALRPEPGERYQDARAFQLAIEEFLLDQRWNASSVHLSEYVKELFAERLAEELRLGRPAPRGADSSTGNLAVQGFPRPSAPAVTRAARPSESSLPRLASSEFDFDFPSPVPETPRRRASSQSVARRLAPEADAQLDDAWDAAAAAPFADDEEDEATQAEALPLALPRRPTRPLKLAEPVPEPPLPDRPRSARGAPAAEARASPPRQTGAAVQAPGPRRNERQPTPEPERPRRTSARARPVPESRDQEPKSIRARDEAPRRSRARDEVSERSPLAVAEMRGDAPRRRGSGIKLAVVLGVVTGLGIVAWGLAPRLQSLPGGLENDSFPAADGAWLSLESNIRVEVSVAGKKLGATPLRNVRVPAGSLQLLLQNQNLGIERTIALEAGSEQELAHREEFNLGKVRVVAEKPCDVYVRGKRIAQTPGPPLDFYEGEYDIECRNDPLGLVGQAHIKIVAGRQKPVEVRVPLRPM